MNSLTITIKEAVEISGLPATFIRKQIDNKIIPQAFSIQNKYRKSYIIYRRPFIMWLESIQTND